MGRTLLSLFVGAAAEVLVFFSLIPDDSTKPPTPWQTGIGYTLLPMVLVKNILGPITDTLPHPLLAVSGFLIFGLGFLLQAAIFGLSITETNRAPERKRDRIGRQSGTAPTGLPWLRTFRRSWAGRGFASPWTGHLVTPTCPS